MSRTYIILQKVNNLSFSGVNTNLVLNNEYYSYNQKGLNKGIVTEFNVKQFLNDSNNERLAIDFFNYLDKNTNEQEMVEIYEDNKKLSDLFKKYYNTSVIFGQQSPISYVNESLSFTTGITINNLNYALTASTVIENIMTGTPATLISSTKRLNNLKNELTTYTTEESYYVELPLNLSIGQISQLNFYDYIKDTLLILSGQTITLKKGFVNLDIKNDQNEFWK